jgi:thiol-disulfide isomerase/thioredoxin
MTNSRHHLAAAALASLLAATAARADAPAPGQRAIDFQATTLAGRPLKLSSLRGKVVLLDFWASWCEPCKKELPLLAEIARKLRPRGVEILAVNIDSDRRLAEEFLRKHEVSLTVLLDPEGAVVKRYDPPKMPTSFVVDREGVLRHVNAGFEAGDEQKIERELTALAGH